MRMQGVQTKEQSEHTLVSWPCMECRHAYQLSFSCGPCVGLCPEEWSGGEALESGVSVLDVSLLRGGHGERDPLHRRLLPLLRDRLDLGEELHASLAVEIQISCE